MLRSTLVGVAAVIAIALASGCSGGSPEAAYMEIQKAAQAGDWGAVYDSIDKRSQGRLDAAMAMLSAFAEGFGGTATPGGTALAGRDLFVAIAGRGEADLADTVDIGEVTDVDVEGDRATLRVSQEDGSESVVHMLKEDGRWKLTLDDATASASGDHSDGQESVAGEAPAETAPSEASPVEDPALGSRENPLPIGTSGQVGDWSITVAAVDTDAADTVAATNQFNDPPGEGQQFVIVGLQATYTGEDSGSYWIEVSNKILGASGNTFDQRCGVIPEDISDTGETFGGATVEGNICLAVDSDQLDGALLIVEESFSFDSTRLFFALQ